MLDLIIPSDGFVEALALENVNDRSEGLAVHHGRVMGQASHNGRLNKVTALSVCQVVATKNDVATKRFGLLNCLLVPLDTDLERRKPC